MIPYITNDPKRYIKNEADMLKKPAKAIKFYYDTHELIAKVSNGHPPQPLPSREGLIYQPSPLVAYGSEPTAQRGEGKGEGVMDFCKSLIL